MSFKQFTPVTTPVGLAWTWAQSVKFSLLKAQQSDQIKSKTAAVYSSLLKSAPLPGSETLQIPVAGPIIMFTFHLSVRKLWI